MIDRLYWFYWWYTLRVAPLVFAYAVLGISALLAILLAYKIFLIVRSLIRR